MRRTPEAYPCPPEPHATTDGQRRRIKYRSWQNHEPGKNIPGGKVLVDITKPGVNTHWQLSGDGQPLARQAWGQTAHSEG
jgi:hypothetical protein